LEPELRRIPFEAGSALLLTLFVESNSCWFVVILLMAFLMGLEGEVGEIRLFLYNRASFGKVYGGLRAKVWHMLLLGLLKRPDLVDLSRIETFSWCLLFIYRKYGAGDILCMWRVNSNVVGVFEGERDMAGPCSYGVIK